MDNNNLSPILIMISVIGMGFIGLICGIPIGAPEAGAIVFSIGTAAAFIVKAIQDK